MRCKRHLSDSSSTVGVCATCVHERLLSVIAAQSSSHSQSHSQSHRSRSHHQVHAQLLAAASSLEDHRKSDSKSHQYHPPPKQQQNPILFPRSVSPYVPRGKHDAASIFIHDDDENETLPDRRFYSTPQFGAPTVKKKHGRLGFISSLFKPRSNKSEFEIEIESATAAAIPPFSTSSSSSWFSSILIRRKHKSKPAEWLPRRVVVLDRGMTPERASCADGSEFESFSESCKRTPARGFSKPSSNLSGMAFCMSPLVRASPSQLWNQKSIPVDIGCSGELRSSGNPPHLSTASSHCANRSRKLADFGRSGYHH